MRFSAVGGFFLLFKWFFVLISCENSNQFRLHKLRESGIGFIDIAKKFEVTDLLNISVTLKCANHMKELIENNREALIKMADAWSKFPYTGVLTASRNDYGGYDECIAVKVQSKEGNSILGKHCTYGLIIPDITISNTTEMFEKGWKLSYCIPHLCTADDLNAVIGLPLFNEAVCSTQETDNQLDTGAIVAVSIFGTLGLLIIASTIYDLWIHKHNEKPILVLTAFSLYSNGKRLLTFAGHSKEQILCFNGIKFISMWWIISGHSAIAWLSYPVTNDEWRTKWQNDIYSEYIVRAHLAVDSFFFISGFLLAYLYFKNRLSKQPFVTQIQAIPSMIIHRYLRLTPAVLMTFLFAVYLLKYTGDGPLFSYRVDGALTEPCKDYWWAVFMYIQNYYIFYLGSELCITTLWYVCVDMQLFLLAPLVTIPVALLNRKSFKTAIAALFGINILFIAVPIFTKLVWKSYDPDLNEYDTQSRLSDYFIGVMMGFFMRHERVRNFRVTKIINILTWFVVLMVMFAVVVVTQEVSINYGYISKTLCYSFTRPLWCIGLCWITFACFTGHGSFINWILSNRFMQLGGKLTYCLYLVHGPIVIHYTLTTKTRRDFSDYHLFHDWSGHFIISMIIATIWTLAFELPMITIEKVIFGKQVDKQLTKNSNNQTT